MSFQFRFDALLQLRRRERDEVGAAVGQANAAIERIDQQVAEISRQRQALRHENQSARVGNVSVDGLLSVGRYDMQLEAETQSLLQTRLQLQQELARRQQTLVAAEAEVKRFEKLRDSDRNRYDLEQQTREQQEADEATSQRYTLRLQGRSNDFKADQRI